MATLPISRLIPALVALLLACALAVAIYGPALSGGLYVDDYYNLRPLDQIETRGYAAYVFSGVSGLTGRPVSMFSFALQHRSWPGDVAAFKAVNLALHLLIGWLVFLVLRAAAPAPAAESRTAGFVPAAAAALWLLHPMQVSTVLYTVQRMTQLSALFVLLGVWGFLRGRRLCDRNPRAGYALMSASVLAGTALAALSKENGALLPLLVLVVDVTLLRGWSAPPGYTRWRAVFLFLPTALIGAYLISVALHGHGTFPGRSYTMYQKALTEASVLLHYLAVLVAPHPGAYGLYHDDFPIARGLLDPPSTAASVLAVLGLVASAVMLRRRAAPAAFALLWFFGGHVIESTHLNLAIYFEHRNYLPSIGICWLLAWSCAAAVRRVTRPALVGAGAALYAILLVWGSFAAAAPWKDPLRMALEGVRAHPDSPAALTALGNRYLAAGAVDGALRLYRDMQARFPDEVYPPLKQAAVLACVRDDAMPDAHWDAMLQQARRAGPPLFEILGELDTLISAIDGGECRALDQARLLQWMEVLADNPAFRRERGGLLQLAANLRLSRREPEEALADLAAAVRASPTLERQRQLLELQLSTGRVADAARGLETFERSLDARPLTRLAYDADVRELRDRLRGLERGRTDAAPAPP